MTLALLLGLGGGGLVGLLGVGIFRFLRRRILDGLKGVDRAVARAFLRDRRRPELLFLLIFIGGLILSGLIWIRPVLGLVGMISVPALFQRYLFERQRSRIEQLEESSIAFFYALQGLVRIGVSLPTGLFELSNSLNSPFARLLRGALRRYERGVSLPDCLARFRALANLQRSFIGLTICEIAYRNGLPLTPFLDHWVPLLEAEQSMHLRMAALKRSLRAQILFTGLMPWGLFAVLFLFQSDVVGESFRSPVFWSVVGISLFLEWWGGRWLWRMTDFL